MSKVIFSDTRKTKIVSLPSIEGSKVEVYTELNIGQQRAISQYEDKFEQGIAGAVIAIKDWNLYKSEDEKCPITKETLEMLKQEDLLAIFTAFTGKTTEELMQAGTQAGAQAGQAEVKKNTQIG